MIVFFLFLHWLFEETLVGGDNCSWPPGPFHIWSLPVLLCASRTGHSSDDHHKPLAMLCPCLYHLSLGDCKYTACLHRSGASLCMLWFFFDPGHPVLWLAFFFLLSMLVTYRLFIKSPPCSSANCWILSIFVLSSSFGNFTILHLK